MRIALLTDIHANREALEAVLREVHAFAPDRIVLLGDTVGYGPDPVHAVETVAGLVDNGALCLLGNHDEAVFKSSKGMGETARDAIRWTRDRLAPAHVAFLSSLPLTAAFDDRLYVHASAEDPEKWRYITDLQAAEACLAATSARHIFCGHTHVPALYYMLPGKSPVHFRPIDNVAAPLSALRRHVTVVGAVGQPRDRNPAACFALLDTDRLTITMLRVPYDHDETARKVAASGLPDWLGLRLRTGS